MNLDDPCLDQQIGRRRIFWTTQAEACGDYTLCGSPCVIPGLEYIDKDDPYVDPGMLPASSGYRTIKNTEWLQSLILNILNTRARTDLKCPSPAAVYGHWSESYRRDKLHIGSRLWNAADKAYVRIADAVKAIQTAVTYDMAKLPAMGVADKVDVETFYKGRNTVGIVITATVRQTQHVLNLSGAFVSGSWVWQ
jgi:hypothetical protein